MSQKEGITQKFRLKLPNDEAIQNKDASSGQLSYRSTGSSKSKFNDSWKTHLLPEFQADLASHEISPSTTDIRRKMSSSFKGGSTDKLSKKASALIETTLELTPKMTERTLMLNEVNTIRSSRNFKDEMKKKPKQ